jgi:hypothetical protein
MGSGTIRIGGACGVVAASTAIPAYVAGSPERPENAEQSVAYFDSVTSFLTANATVPLAHTWVGLPGAYSMVAWLGLTGLTMLAVPPVVRMESIGA